MSNKLLAKMAARVLTGFPNVFEDGEWVGNPVKSVIADLPAPQERFATRSGALKLAVIGGSLGAQALNENVPKALALLSDNERPEVVHQAGEKLIDALRRNYQEAGVQAQCVPFVDDMAALYADSDVLICRAGAMTVSELAAAGVASIMVPFPAAVDDHQTSNAQLLVDAGAGQLLPQTQLTPAHLAELLRGLNREQLSQQAANARTVAKPNATADVAKVCLQVAGVRDL